MATNRGLTVREHERQQIEMPVEFVIDEDHRGQVRFSGASGAIDQHTVGGVTVDLSVGGLGFVAAQFLPRNTEGVVYIFEPGTPSRCIKDGAAGGPPRDQAFIEHPVKVRRVWMNVRDNTYSIGLAFVNPTPKLEEQVQRLVAMFHESRVEHAEVNRHA